MTHPFYESTIEETEPKGDYCPSIDAEPEPEPKPPFRPLWKMDRSRKDSRIHSCEGHTFYTGRHICGKYAAIDLQTTIYSPPLQINRESLARHMKYLRKEARNARR
jgi:hypothetical protein